MTGAYYNEFDPAAAAILRQLIADDVIAPGEVDTRSIKEVQPDDLNGFTQCHFFAGGGLWSLACRGAGWSDDRPIWTASCPCQPFSAAGKRGGTDDPRHLWPDLLRLVRAKRPAVIVGEQVAGAPGYGWFDGVRADLEAESYAARAVDFPACAIDAPHKRNRLYWSAVDYVIGARWEGQRGDVNGSGRPETGGPATAPDGANDNRNVANGASAGRNAGTLTGVCGSAESEGSRHGEPERLSCANDNGAVDLRAYTDRCGRAGREEGSIRHPFNGTSVERSLLRNGTYWSGAEWITGHDGKARRTKPGIRFLVDGLPGRVDLWRVAGNAIVPQAAQEVIAALAETLDAYAEAA